jgi:hypothetical protein
MTGNYAVKELVFIHILLYANNPILFSRVERLVASPLPHRSGRAAFQHPVPQ